MLFCPSCHNLLLSSTARSGAVFFCTNCIYSYSVSQPVQDKIALSHPNCNDNYRIKRDREKYEKISKSCQACGHPEVFRFSLVMRPNEKPTVFNECEKCDYYWRV